MARHKHTKRSRHSTRRRPRFEGLESRRLLAGNAFHNPVVPADVSGDQVVTPQDALMVVIDLNRGAGLLGEGESSAHRSNDHFPDVNADGMITPQDALHVVDFINRPTGDIVNELHARLNSSDGAHGEVEYELEKEDATARRKFKVELEDAQPNASYDVAIDGTVVGELQTDAQGNGRLVFSDRASDGQSAFPDNFPAITRDSVVTVGSASATLGFTSEDTSADNSASDDGPNHDVNDDSRTGIDDSSSDDGPNHDVNDDRVTGIDDSHSGDHSSDDSASGESHDDHTSSHDDGPNHDVNDDSRTGIDDSHGSDHSSISDMEMHETELVARYRGSGKVRGKAKFEVEREHGGWEVKFEVKVRGSSRGQHDVLIDGVKVGTVRIDNRGRGELEMSTRPDDDKGLLPADFPEITVGSTVEVSGLFTASFHQDD